MSEIRDRLRALAERHDRMAARASYGACGGPMVNILGQPLRPEQIAAVEASRATREYHRQASQDLRIAIGALAVLESIG